MEAGKLGKQTGHAGQLNVPGKADAVFLSSGPTGTRLETSSLGYGLENYFVKPQSLFSRPSTSWMSLMRIMEGSWLGPLV